MSMTGGAFPPKMARLLFTIRENECCFYCGKGLRWEDRGIGWSLHHRKPRGMGGTRTPVTASCGLVLCGSGTTGCHGWVESHRAVALELGLLVSTNGIEKPVNVPVTNQAGDQFWLTDHGSAVPVGPDHPF